MENMLRLHYRSFCPRKYHNLLIYLNKRHYAKDTKRSFEEIQQSRWSQAQRSVHVQYTGSVSDCLDHCERHGGHIRGAYNYTVTSEDTQHTKFQVLVELSSANAVRRLLYNSRQFPNDEHVPVRTRQLYYRGQDTRRYGLRRDNRHDPRLRKPAPVEISLEALAGMSSVSKQMSSLYQNLSLNDFGLRTRYFIASVVEEFVQCALPDSRIRLFGSTVNGFGRYDCDLDMVLDVNNAKQSQDQNRSGDLLFLSKTHQEDDRPHIVSLLDFAAAGLRSALPLFGNVQRVPRARVPIVKFTHVGYGVDCDLCVSNQSALNMSRLLHQFGDLDTRVRPLVFTIRHWARTNQITLSYPGPWLSNFMLTLLVVFYLQNQAIIPTVCDIIKTKEDLLGGFLKFYANFDFKQRGISVYDLDQSQRPEEPALYLENPLDREVNCSKNVMEKHLSVFQANCKDSLEKLEHSNNGIVSILTPDVKVSDSVSERLAELEENGDETAQGQS